MASFKSPSSILGLRPDGFEFGFLRWCNFLCLRSLGRVWVLVEGSKFWLRVQGVGLRFLAAIYFRASIKVLPPAT